MRFTTGKPYALIYVHCAECSDHDWPLVTVFGHFDTIDAAKEKVVADYADRKYPPAFDWSPHPLGGEFFRSEGEYWIAPTDALTRLSPDNEDDA